MRKLRHGTCLTEDDELILGSLAGPLHRVGRGDIASEGAAPLAVVLVVDGWVCRYKQLENGKRQITSIFLPGDLCGPFGALPPSTHHALAALTPALLTYLPPHAIRAAAQASPRIEEAMWWDLLFAEALHREHIVGLGRRSATERLGYFFCDVQLRLDMVGMCDGWSYDMPLTQSDLADLFGLSAVHVNRSLQELRGSGLLSLRGRRVDVHDLQGLRELSLFDPICLPLRGAILSGDGGHDRDQDGARHP